MVMLYKEFNEITKVVRKNNDVPEGCVIHYNENDFKDVMNKLDDTCYNSVQYYTYLCGIFAKKPDAISEKPNGPKAARVAGDCYFIEGKTKSISNETALQSQPAGNALIFTGVDQTGKPIAQSNVSHIMVTCGGGSAMGSNNGKLDPNIGWQEGWSRLNLSQCVKFNTDGSAYSPINNNERLGLVFYTPLRYIHCINAGGCQCKL